MKIKNFLKSQKAAAMGEYAFLLVLIGLAVLPFVFRFGVANQTLFNDISRYINGTVVDPAQQEIVYVYLDDLDPLPQNDTTPITTNPTTGDIPSGSCGTWAIAVDTSDTSHFEVGGDSDWWLLEVQAKSDLQFILQGEDLGDGQGAADLVEFTLRDFSGAALSTMRYGNPAYHLQNDVEPGQYCLHAESRNSGSVGGYRLSVNEVYDIPYDITDRNTVLTFDTIGTEEFQLGDQGDAWEFYVPETTDVVARAYGGSANRRIRLLDDQGNSLAVTANSTSIAAVTWNDLEPGTYYARVERASGYDAYNMLIQSVDDLASRSQVQGGAEANELTLNASPITSTLYAGETGDLHEVTVTSSGTLSMNVTSLGLLTEMRIYNSSFSQLGGYEVSSSNGSTETHTASVTPGTYYLEVRRRNSSSIGDYTLQATMP